jgi:hypothetical protein
VRQYKEPDLNAPRFRPKKLNFTNTDFYNRFILENPKYAFLTLSQFKDIIKVYNGKMWKVAVAERDGIELPEQLGYIFIGSCPKKKSNVDFKKSKDYGQILQSTNWESDDYLAKIFYTNFETKYRFKNHDLWSFVGLRDFKREVCKGYRADWKKYVMVDNLIKVSRIFRKEKEKDLQKTETQDLLKNYDEFNLD